MNYKFVLVVLNEDTEEIVGKVETLSLESLQEQLHKVEGAIKRYEQKNDDTDDD